MKSVLWVVVLLSLSACGRPADVTVVDQCLRAELFKQCMASLPQGPVSTKYNDWDEVVDSCESASYGQSMRKRGHVRPECQQ